MGFNLWPHSALILQFFKVNEDQSQEARVESVVPTVVKINKFDQLSSKNDNKAGLIFILVHRTKPLKNPRLQQIISNCDQIKLCLLLKLKIWMVKLD